MEICNIAKFEKLNTEKSVNVYDLELIKRKYIMQPLRITSNKRKKHTSLLMIAKKYKDVNDDDEHLYH